MKFLDLIKRFLKLINPLPPIGGLAITDTSLHFLLINESQKLKAASLKLPPGIIINGKVKDAQNLKLALKNLHAQIAPAAKPVSIVLTLPGALVYTQVFSIPLLAEDKLSEAAALNLQMISPIDFVSAYSGWQKVGEGLAQGSEIELLGAFAEKARVDEFYRILAGSNFIVAAVEFPALALSRTLGASGEIDVQESSVLLDVSHDGAALMILKNSNLYFNHFHSWNSIQEEIGGKKISADDFSGFLTREFQKVLNFYSSHWGGSINTLILINPNLGRELTEHLEQNFSFKIKPLSVKNFPTLAPAQFAVFGSALRGLLPRSRDAYLSLTTAPVQVQYREARILNFAGLWRKIAVTVLIFILVIFAALDIFFSSYGRKLEKQISTSLSPEDLSQVEELTREANAFNQLVNAAFEAKSETAEWSVFLRRLNDLAASQITLRRVNVSVQDIAVSGVSANESAVLAFKDRLFREENFESLSLPLTNINANPDGTVNFNLTFKLKSLEF